MVEIVIEPWKKIVIHEVIELEFEDLLKIITVGVPPGGRTHAMQWANGVVFAQAPFPDIEPSIEEKIKGIIHYASVQFALKPKFESEIIDTERNITIPFIDVSHNELFVQLTELLKKQSKFR